MWRWWSVVMSGDFRCQERKKMMGGGADGGCGTEERPCRPAVFKFPAKISEIKNETVSIDAFSQARKALSERCPFDEAGEDGVLKETNLPSGLASLLKQNDGRKRHKKSHSGAHKNKKSSSKSERSKEASIWVKTEEYFRDLRLSDIDALSEVASVSSLPWKKCFLIPFLGNDIGDNVNVDVDANVSGGECVSCGNGDVNEGVVKVEVKVEKKEDEPKEHEQTEDEKQFMEIDSLGADCLIKEEKSCDISDSYVGLEWLLGCRTRALLTSEPPSKKRKLLGGDAGLEKILFGCPCEGNSGLCDFCCIGDMGKKLNKLIVCSSCKVAVHQKCYGVKESVDGSWLCSWCQEKNDMGDSVKQPCVLCPKQGGALKPVHGGSIEFAHLFCSLLMPKVYIEDTMKMEPIMNVGGIKENRMKLVCNICRVKHGACVRCSHVQSPTDPVGFEDSLARRSPMFEGSTAKPLDYGFCERKAEPSSGFYVHPYIQKSLQMQSVMLTGNKVQECDGSGGGEISRLEASSTASVCCNHQGQHSKCSDMICKSDGVNLGQLVKARTWGVLELYTTDEVEGEIIYFQLSLIGNAVARKRFADNLVCKVGKSLPQEIDAARGRRWDAVLVYQYLCELREAKRQGRKERRHKEAQAVLAAATAAAAASSRISSFRKDSLDESASQEVMSWAKETLSSVAVPRVLSDKYSDIIHSVSDISKEHPRSCDICRRSETILNPILLCSSCKVAVHLDCYRSIRESTGPWYCELCEELLSSRSSGASSVNFWEKTYSVAECSLCGGTTGAFRKSADGQWVHAFCAEWVFESTFRRGQVNPVAGMETFPKGIDVCFICRHKHGICIKCNYGHCQTTFHRTCARSAGFYMNVKSAGGNFQHKAYCEKHSLEQKIKAETQKHGVEELKCIKQIRVELERLRLLCERIIKREKIKRELILCSHEILAFKRDHAARLVHGHVPFFPPDVSSESVTTSLKGHTNSYKSCSKAFQRSDDVTMDSSASVNNRIKVFVPMDADQRMDDSSMSQNLYPQKPSERVQF